MNNTQIIKTIYLCTLVDLQTFSLWP